MAVLTAMRIERSSFQRYMSANMEMLMATAKRRGY